MNANYSTIAELLPVPLLTIIRPLLLFLPNSNGVRVVEGLEELANLMKSHVYWLCCSQWRTRPFPCSVSLLLSTLIFLLLFFRTLRLDSNQGLSSSFLTILPESMN